MFILCSFNIFPLKLHSSNLHGVSKIPDLQGTGISLNLFIRKRGECKISVLYVLLGFSLTVKAASHECVIRTGLP